MQAVRHWPPYLWGRPFRIRMDHYSLKFLLDQRLSTMPQHQWISKFFVFDFSLEYHSGRLNTVADALSRRDPVAMPTTTGRCHFRRGGLLHSVRALLRLHRRHLPSHRERRGRTSPPLAPRDGRPGGAVAPGCRLAPARAQALRAGPWRPAPSGPATSPLSGPRGSAEDTPPSSGRFLHPR